MCEQIQRSFSSGAQEYIQFGRNEPALIHFHSTIDRLLGLETPVTLPVLAGVGPSSGA